MTTNQQSNNGQSQINNTRETFNNKVSRLSMLGKSKRITWDKSRRNRSI